MSAKVVLPDFNLPGDTPHPAVRALWLAGGLVVVATVILGGALWHRNSVDTAAREATAQTLAALSQRTVAEAAPVAVAAPVAAPTSASATAETPSATDSAAASASTGGERRTHRRGAGHRTSRSLHGHALARANAPIPGSKKSSAKKDDAIDRLLRGFK